MCYKNPTENERKAIISHYGKYYAKRATLVIFLLNTLPIVATPVGHDFFLTMRKFASLSNIEFILYILFGTLWIAFCSFIMGLITGAVIGEVLARVKLRNIKKGLCIKCQYDLRMHDNQCPECGDFQSVLFKKLQY